MIEKFHKKALDILFHSKQPTDNGTQKTIRNLTLKETFSIDEFNKDEKDYTFENGLVLQEEDSDKLKNLTFLDQEWKDWMDGLPLGASKSQYEYPEIWKGKFDKYCYSDRFGPYFQNHVERIVADPESRKNFFSVWTKPDEDQIEVPCTIGYNIQVVDGVAYVSLVYRSIEIVHNFVNDLYLNKRYIQTVLSDIPDVKEVEVTYFVMNAHSYAKSWSPYYIETK